MSHTGTGMTDPSIVTPPPGRRHPWLSFRPEMDAAVGAFLHGRVHAAAVVVLDLIDLPELSGTYGSEMTAAITSEVGHRFLSLLRRGTGPAARPNARLGESRFVTVVDGLGDRDQAFRLGRRLCQDMARPMRVDAVLLAPVICVGISYFDGGPETAAELIDQAETALMEARGHGPGAFCLFSAEMDERMRTRMRLRGSLREAIDLGQLRLNYQPIVDLATGTIRTAEALTRWLHPELGMQSPAEFIPAAEASGLIVELGSQMLLQALRDRRVWADAGIPATPVAVNVSALQLRRPGFVEMVTRSLAETESSPEDLELELTEGSLIETTGDMLDQLALLSRMGLTLTVDDFGTGFSSLRYLRDMPVRKLKIDQHFIRDIAHDARDLSIVRAIVAMARALELEVVAEGIETEEQRLRLLEAGCRIGQGYLFAAPMPATEFAALLRAGAAPPPGLGPACGPG